MHKQANLVPAFFSGARKYNKEKADMTAAGLGSNAVETIDYKNGSLDQHLE